ncbi:hypothetical protein D9M70_526880 [compost metagenome]
MRALERLPQHAGVADQPVTSVESRGHIEASKAPLAIRRICGLIVPIKTRRHVLRIANTVENQLFHHQARDDLGLPGNLQCGLLCEEFLLTDQEGKQLDLLPIETVVNITQPLVLINVIALCLVAEKQHRSASRPCCGLADPQSKTHTFGWIGTCVWIRIANGL